MHHERQDGKFSWGIGAATLLCVFVVLFLTIFAALSVITARSEAQLAEKFSASVTAYYDAESSAARWTGQIADTVKAESAPDNFLARLRTVSAPDITVTGLCQEDGGTVIISAETCISAETGRNLAVTLRISPDAAVTITEWRAFSASERKWEANDGLDLWIPDF